MEWYAKEEPREVPSARIPAEPAVMASTAELGARKIVHRGDLTIFAIGV